MATPRTRRRARRNPHRKEAVPLAVTFGARVRQLRTEGDFSFDAFVEETELGRGYISELERGMVVPLLTTLARIAAALEISLPELVTLGDSLVEQLIDVVRPLTDVQKRRLLREAKRMGETKKRPRRPTS